jgi:hypothetical protein
MARDLSYALDPAIFARECLGFIADPWQSVALRSTDDLLLNCSRQAGKSTFASILASHTAIYWPRSLILAVSPSLRQSSELFRKVTEALTRAGLKSTLSEDNKLSCVLTNGSRIVSLPSSEATIRGYSAVDLLLEDEASRVPDDLYRAVRPMLAISHGRKVLMSTPFGKRGHFHEEWHSKNNWRRIMIKATDIPRITPEFLEAERASLGEWWYKQEYMCEFVETTDQVFSYDLVIKAITPEVKPLFAVAHA